MTLYEKDMDAPLPHPYKKLDPYTNYHVEYSQLRTPLQVQETCIHLYYKHDSDPHTRHYFMIDACNRIQMIYPLYSGKIKQQKIREQIS